MPNIALSNRLLRREWHKQIELIVGSQYGRSEASDGQRLTEVHLNELRRHTTAYLRKRKIEWPSEACDAELSDLIERHGFLDGRRKSVAVISCFYAISQSVARSHLQLHLLPGPGARHQRRQYLEALDILHTANPDAVTEAEGRCARGLVALQSADVATFGQELQGVLESLRKIFIFDLLPLNLVQDLIGAGSLTFFARIGVLQENKHYFTIAQMIGWTRSVSQYGPLAENLLDQASHSWRMWAAWWPDAGRLARYEAQVDALPPEFRDVISLEGPDTSGRGRTTLRHGMLSHSPPCPQSFSCGSLQINAPATDLLPQIDRLLAVFDQALVSGPEAIALFHHFLRQVIEEPCVGLLEAVLRTQDAVIAEIVLTILSPPAYGNRMPALTRLLPFLETHRDLLRFFGHYYYSAGSTLRDAQATFCKQLQKGCVGDNIGMRIFEFGKAIRHVPWLQGSLSSDLTSMIDGWPTQASLERLFKLKQDVRKSNLGSDGNVQNAIDGFLMAHLGNRGATNKTQKSIVNALIQREGQAIDPDRYAVAMAIGGHVNLDPTARHQCIGEVYTNAVDEEFIEVLLPFIGMQNHMACVRLADLLVQQQIASRPGTDCWRKLLQCLIQNRESTMDHVAKDLDVSSWFSWIRNLRAIFGSWIDEGRLQPPFPKALYLWNELLARRYSDVLIDLEKALGNTSKVDLRFILFDGSPPVRDFLQAIRQANRLHYEKLIQFIRLHFRTNDNKAKVISDALVRHPVC